MTTLIAGGCGFIGLAVAERYLEDSAEVVLFDRNPLHPVAKARLDSLPGAYTLVQGDIRQAEPVAQAIGDHKVDQVFYGAAVTSGPDREREAPESVIEVNLVGLAHTLKAAWKAGAKRLINISSGAAYGTGAFGDTGWDGPLDEYGTREEPFKIYGMTKYGSERLVRRYAELTDLDARSVRLSTIFGPWEVDSGARDTLSAPMQAALIARKGGTAVFDRRDHLDWTYSRHVAGALGGGPVHAPPLVASRGRQPFGAQPIDELLCVEPEARGQGDVGRRHGLRVDRHVTPTAAQQVDRLRLERPDDAERARRRERTSER
jgi:nucleoside-diphosphate-sugar epimerase